MIGYESKIAFAVGAMVAASMGVPASASAQSPSTTPSNTSNPASAPQLTEVIVTARRSEERLQDVPISITVLSQEQLTDNNITKAEDLATLTPSLSVNNNFGSENASFGIRGFVQDTGTAPSVGTYFADVVAPRGPAQGTQAGDSLGPGSFFDLQNVQVLKGPQGTLFGRNTTGGAVLLVPQKPTARAEGYLEASGGNNEMWRLQGAANAPLTDDALFRFAFDHQEREGYLRNVSGIGPRDFNDVNYTALRASLVLDLTPNVENYTIASYSKSETNGSVQKLIAAGQAGFNPPNPQLGVPNFLSLFSAGQLASEAARRTGFWDVEAAVANPKSLLEQWQVVNTTAWHVSDALSIKNIASYAQYRNLQRSPLFGTNWQLGNLPAVYSQVFFMGIPAVFTGIFPAPGRNTSDQSTYTEELQLQGSAMDQRLTYQAGVYFEWSDPLSPVGAQSSQLASCVNLATINCSDPIGTAFTGVTAFSLAQLGVPPPYPNIHIGSVNYTVGQTTYRDRGVYTQSSYSITDQVKLTAGARYTWDEQTNEATRITYNFPVSATDTARSFCTDPATGPSCRLAQDKKSSKPTWLIDLDYKPTDDVLLYGKYARGYRAGGVITNAPTDHRVFDPEKVDNYEVGMKTSYSGAVPGVFNIAAFYNDFSNQQLQFGFNPFQDPVTGATAPVSPTTAVINAGKSRIYGAEVEASIAPLRGLTFDLNYTYLKAEIRSISPVATTDANYTAAAGNITPGAPLALSPKNKYTLSGKYVLPLEGNIGDVSLGATFIHVDEQLTTYAYLNPATVAAVGGNYGTVAGHDLLNLNVSWSSVFGSPVDITAFATNVANEKYYNFVPGLASAQSAVEFATVGEPRMYGARVRYRFGQ
jgi:iron complex outermembrane receptor protein